MSKPATAAEPALKKPKALADYWEVICLKRTDRAGLWDTASALFPTEEEANAHADALREGNQSAIKVLPRNWA